MIDILPKTQRDIQEFLHESAVKHASRSNGLLVPLDIDEEQYPWQDLTHPFVRANRETGPLDPFQADAIAGSIDGRYNDLTAAFDTYSEGELGQNIERIAELLKSGIGVINGADHAELLDIAFSHLNFANIFRRRGIALRSGLVVSKMVDFLGLNTGGEAATPLRELLALGFHKSYLTLPRTSSTDGKLEVKVVKTYNSFVRNEIRGDFDRRARSNRVPLFLGVALPGTVNKPSADDPETIVVGRVSDGVLDFARQAMTVATGIRMRHEGSSLFIDGIPTSLQKREEINAFMGRLIKGITELDGLSYAYDEDGTMPVLDQKTTE